MRQETAVCHNVIHSAESTPEGQGDAGPDAVRSALSGGFWNED